MRYEEPLLTIRDLSVGYGQSLVLTYVALDVTQGQVVCLMGRNGVGKTTLLKAIMGLLNPRSGKVKFAQSEMTKWPPHRRARAGFGYVPQGRHVFPYLSVHDNLLMGLEAADGAESRGRRAGPDVRAFPGAQDLPSQGSWNTQRRAAAVGPGPCPHPPTVAAPAG